MQVSSTPPAFLRVPILLLTLAVWAIVGFFFWIPLLARSVAIYCAVLLSTTLTAKDIRPAAGQLQFAIGFWVAGFRNVLDTFHTMEKGQAGAVTTGSLEFWPVIRELAWSFIFWFVTLQWSFVFWFVTVHTFGLIPRF